VLVEIVITVIRRGIAFVKLFVGEFEIEIKHRRGGCGKLEIGNGLPAADAVADLYGEDGFAYVGIGKEDAELTFEPKAIEEHACFGLFGGGFEPCACFFDNESAFNSFGWVEVFIYFGG